MQSPTATPPGEDDERCQRNKGVDYSVSDSAHQYFQSAGARKPTGRQQGAQRQ